MKDWQDGLRALLPNINISFGGAPQQSSVPTTQTQKQPQTQTQKSEFIQECCTVARNLATCLKEFGFFACMVLVFICFKFHLCWATLWCDQFRIFFAVVHYFLVAVGFSFTHLCSGKYVHVWQTSLLLLLPSCIFFLCGWANWTLQDNQVGLDTCLWGEQNGRSRDTCNTSLSQNFEMQLQIQQGMKLFIVISF